MSRRVLIIEDEPAMRLLLQDFLETVGYEVLTAPDGQTALDIADREEFGVAFVDINLPDITGDEVMRVMRDRGVESKLIVLSGNLPETYEHRIADLEIFEVLEKPVDLLVISDAAERALAPA